MPAPVSWLRGAALGARTPITEFEPLQGVTALGAGFPLPNSGVGRGRSRCERAFLRRKCNPGWGSARWERWSPPSVLRREDRQRAA